MFLYDFYNLAEAFDILISLKRLLPLVNTSLTHCCGLVKSDI